METAPLWEIQHPMEGHCLCLTAVLSVWELPLFEVIRQNLLEVH